MDFPQTLGRAAIFVLVPAVLVLTAVRSLLTEAFIQFEYGLPGFPADPYGLSAADRMRWAPIALDYLLNDEGIEFLGELTFDDGNALYNQRELRHMADVKQLTVAALRVWRWGLLALVALALVIWRTQGAQFLLEQLSDASRLTLIIMGILGLGVAIAFSLLFVGFHRIFFEGSTWLFPRSDTLIRLFPERFWRDAFIFIALGTAIQAGLLWLLSKLALTRVTSA